MNDEGKTKVFIIYNPCSGIQTVYKYIWRIEMVYLEFQNLLLNVTKILRVFWDYEFYNYLVNKIKKIKYKSLNAYLIW